MDKFIIIYNLFVMASAFYMLGIAFVHEKKSTNVIYFFSIFIILLIFNLFFTAVAVLDTYIYCVITAFYINRSKKKFLTSINIAMQIVVYLQICIMFLGSLLSLLSPVLNSYLYFVFMQVWILACAVILKRYKTFFFKLNNNDKLSAYHLLYKIWFMLLMNIVLPTLFDKLGKHYHIIELLFVIICFCSLFYTKYVSSIENKYSRNIANENKLYDRSQDINAKYEEVIKIKHYVFSLYKSTIAFINNKDIEGLKHFYNEHLTPVNEQLSKEIINYRQIDKIHIVLVKSRIIELINAVSIIQNVELAIHIETSINRISIKEIDLFTMLNIFIDNAVEEVKTQGKGMLSVVMTETDNRFICKVENSINGGKSTIKPLNTHKGIEIIKNITKFYSNVKVQTTIELDRFIQILEVEHE